MFNAIGFKRIVRQLKSKGIRVPDLNAAMIAKLVDFDLSEVRDRLAFRARFAAKVKKLSEAGMIGIEVDSTDCDWSRATYTHVMPALPRAVLLYVDKLVEDAEGPTHWDLCRPSDAQPRTSRDLALEAFEDGHPHVIHY